MKRLMSNTVCAAALLAVSAVAVVAETPLGDVVVNKRTNLEGAAADSLVANITRDLEVAIETRLPVTGIDTDALIEVEIVELLLDGDAMLPEDEKFNQIRGTVMYSHPDNAFASEIYPFAITAVEGEVDTIPGFVLVTPDAPDYYLALMAGTAEKVAEMMPEEIVVTAD